MKKKLDGQHFIDICKSVGIGIGERPFKFLKQKKKLKLKIKSTNGWFEFVSNLIKAWRQPRSHQTFYIYTAIYSAPWVLVKFGYWLSLIWVVGTDLDIKHEQGPVLSFHSVYICIYGVYLVCTCICPFFLSFAPYYVCIYGYSLHFFSLLALLHPAYAQLTSFAAIWRSPYGYASNGGLKCYPAWHRHVGARDRGVCIYN